MKKNVKSSGKRKKCQTNVTKLNNKRLNKLARQGKLKGRTGGLDKQNYRQILQNRIRPHEQKRLVEEDEDCGKERIRPDIGDIPLEEADYNYFSTENENRHLGFLENNLELKQVNKKSKNAKKHLESYEEQPRLKPSNVELNSKPMLPIKGRHGRIMLKTLEEEIEPINDENDLEKNGSEQESEEEEEVELPPITTEQLLFNRKEKLIAKRILISTSCSQLIENPQLHVKKLAILQELLNEKDPDIFITVRKLSMMSLLEVYKDIIPSYRIRELTELERSQKMKKETKCIVDFEDTLLLSYKAYLTSLELMIKGTACKSMSNRKRKAFVALDMPDQAFKEIRKLALKCLLDLLTSLPHFNFRTNIISLAVPFIDHRDSKVSKNVYDSICRVFAEDKEGEVTLEIVRLIGRLVKSRHFCVKPLVLDTFLTLKIKEIELPDGNKKKKFKREKSTRREKKRKKQIFELEKEFDNADMATNKRKRLRFNAEIINLVFLTYFRILKQARHSILLSSVLAGLARFSHLINVEFFDDLFAVINNLVDSDVSTMTLETRPHSNSSSTIQELTHRNSLHCIQTAFNILSGQGDLLNIDPLRFYNHLYANLYNLHCGESSEDVYILLECITSMIGKRRKQISRPRLLAFIKRLSILSIHQLSNGTLAILSALRKFIKIDSKLDIIFDTDCQGSGTYDGVLNEPEYCNAHNTCMFELYLLKKHYHPSVRQMSLNFIAGLPSQGTEQLSIDLSRSSPVEIFKSYCCKEMKFRPSVKGKANVTNEFCQKEIVDLTKETFESVISAKELNFAKKLRNKIK